MFGTITSEFIDLGGNWQLVLLEFDENEILKRYEIETGKETIGAGQVTTEGQGLPETNVSSRVLYETSQWKWTRDDTFRDVEFSPDGNLVAAINSDRVLLRNLETDELREFKPENTSTIFDCAFERDLAFAPDGASLAVLTSDISIVNVATLQAVLNFKDHGSSCSWNIRVARAMAFAPDGKTMASGDFEGVIKVWDPSTGAVIKSFKAHEGLILSIAFSPDGRLLATSSQDKDNSVKIWDLSTGKEQAVLKQHTGIVKFSPIGNILAIHSGPLVEIWEVDSSTSNKAVANSNQPGRLIDVIMVPIARPDSGGYLLRPALEFSPDGEWIAASFGSAIIYDIAARKQVWRFVPDVTKGEDVITDLSFSPASKNVLAATSMRKIYLWTLPLKD